MLKSQGGNPKKILIRWPILSSQKVLSSVLKASLFLITRGRLPATSLDKLGAVAGLAVSAGAFIERRQSQLALPQ